MKILFWIINAAWYFLITVIATSYWKGFGWWFLLVCAIVLMLGEKWLRFIFKKTSS